MTASWLRYIPPSELSDHWDLIKPGLEKVRSRSGDWRCEDVYASILEGSSTLHIADTDGYGGFVVLSPLKSISGKSLHITAAFSNGARSIDEYLPELKNMASNIGAKLTFSSKRNWSRHFKYKTKVYEV